MIVVTESESNGMGPANPWAKTRRESARLGKAESKLNVSARFEGAGARTAELRPTESASIEKKLIDKKVEGVTETERKNPTDRLKRGSESERKAYLSKQLERLEYRRRQLNLPAERRAFFEFDNTEHHTERGREQLARSKLRANEISEAKNVEHRAEQRKAQLERVYTNFTEQLSNSMLEKRDAKKIKVDGKDLIISRDASQRLDSPEFWNHHANTKEVYDKFARQFPEIQKQLAKGKTVEEIRKDPELKNATKFWYSEQDVVANEYKGYVFVEKGYHRASLAREYDLKDVPVSVYEWREKEAT